MTETERLASRTAVKGARRAAVIAIVVSLGITALVGIVVILSGSSNETLGRILETTLVLAAFSVTALCHLAVVGRAPQVVGFVGIVASALAFVAAVVLIWGNWNFSSVFTDWWLRTLWTFTVVALSLAHANLMLLLEGRKNRVVRIGLRSTLVFIAVVALGIITPVLSGGHVPGDNGDVYWRTFAVIAILDVLGTIVLPVTGIFLRDAPRAAIAGGAAAASIPISTALAASLDEIAVARNSSREAVAVDILQKAVADQTRVDAE
jgi:hypothetical protein